MEKIHISLIGLHISLVGGLLTIEEHLSGVEQSAIPFLMILGGLLLTLGTLLGYVSFNRNGGAQ
ncbi:hypothetical protein SAMN04515672_0545 [Natronorubrum texcoconense]|uniref:Uncharacterized protein n=1 Tax=Natronorubrum texcoconense TaxID=1095776 RepID=A0A1G8TPD8_9EURY|nr:hypothetical protein SAMN04515672_0545 [Natronorubrum texcoconense]